MQHTARTTLFVLTGALFLGSVVGVYAADPFLTLDIFSGKPGSTIQVSGGNFTSGETVNILLGSSSSTPAANAVAAENSLFGPVSVQIPLNAPGGAFAV